MPCRKYFALLVLLLSSFSSAEDRSGNAAQLVKESILRSEPSKRSPSLGRLPKGTILTLTGERKNDYAAVEVELEDGIADGWIPIDSLNRQASEGEDYDAGPPTKIRLKRDTDEESGRRLRSRNRVVIPKDEGLLLRRDYSFFYGLQLGGTYAIMTSEAGNSYRGIGFLAGAHLGFYLGQNVPLALDFSYSQANGRGDDGTLELGFFDTFVHIGYQIDRFGAFVGAQYSYGLSLNNIPTSIQVASASDLSAIYGMGGLSYSLSVGELTDLVFRGRYGFSFTQSPLLYNLIVVTVGVQFNG